MTCKTVIFAVVSLLPAFVFAQGVPAETNSAPESAGGDIGDTSQTASGPSEGETVPGAVSEAISAESEGAPTTDLPVEQIAEDPEAKPVVEPVVISDDDTLYMRLAKGHQVFMQNDYQGALSVYESAKRMEPGEAETYIYISYTLGKLDRYDDAMVTLAAASAPVENQSDLIRAKALFARAAIEEMRGPLEAVKEGWMAYEEYAQAHDDVATFLSTATARLAALQKMQDLDEKYQLVRERIAANSQ